MPYDLVTLLVLEMIRLVTRTQAVGISVVLLDIHIALTLGKCAAPRRFLLYLAMLVYFTIRFRRICPNNPGPCRDGHQTDKCCHRA